MPTSTTTAAPPRPRDWDRLRLNAVEVTYDLRRDATEIRVANSFFMLDGYSEIKRRLMHSQRARRARNRGSRPRSLLLDTEDSPGN